MRRWSQEKKTLFPRKYDKKNETKNIKTNKNHNDYDNDNDNDKIKSKSKYINKAYPSLIYIVEKFLFVSL